jgi:hypothetical protein
MVQYAPCRHCRMDVPKGASVCGYCGKDAPHEVGLVKAVKLVAAALGVWAAVGALCVYGTTQEGPGRVRSPPVAPAPVVQPRSAPQQAVDATTLRKPDGRRETALHAIVDAAIGPSASPDGAAYIAKLKLSKVRGEKNEFLPGYAFVNFTVKNVGERTVDDVEVLVFLLDAKGQPIMEHRDWLGWSVTLGNPSPPLKANYSRAVQIQIQGVADEWSGKARVEIAGVKVR